jgi:hypothetical protein
MRLISARSIWHDAYYARGDSCLAYAIELAKLGSDVQMTEIDSRTLQSAHQAVAGRVQSAIAGLPQYLQAFGHWMYSPIATDDHRETAEAAVFMAAYGKAGKMTAKNRDRARYVAKGVLFRYRRVNQGGQGAGFDPLRKPEEFRAWLEDIYGTVLPAQSWEARWGAFVRLCFDACDDIDRAALAPVARALAEMLGRDLSRSSDPA